MIELSLTRQQADSLLPVLERRTQRLSDLLSAQITNLPQGCDDWIATEQELTLWRGLLEGLLIAQYEAGQ